MTIIYYFLYVMILVALYMSRLSANVVKEKLPYILELRISKTINFSKKTMVYGILIYVTVILLLDASIVTA